MGVNVVVDDELAREIRAVTGLEDDSAAIEQVLRRVLAGRRKHKSILDLAGKVTFYEGYDPKALRS